MSDESPMEWNPELAARWRDQRAPPRLDSLRGEQERGEDGLDAMLLAAWAEGRLTEDEASAIEADLANDPALLETALASRRMLDAETPSPAFLRRAHGLVADTQNPMRGTVVEFRPRRRAATWVVWGAVAASFLLVSFVGFGVGVSTVDNLSGPQQENPSDMLDAAAPADGDIG